MSPSRAELEAADGIERKVARLHPGVVAVLGKGLYGLGFGVKDVQLGPQPKPIEGAPLWVLPNPSPINASYPKEDLARRFAELRDALG